MLACEAEHAPRKQITVLDSFLEDCLRSTNPLSLVRVIYYDQFVLSVLVQEK